MVRHFAKNQFFSCQGIYTVLTAVRKWYQQAISTDTTGQTEVSTEFADRGIYVPIKR